MGHISSFTLDSREVAAVNDLLHETASRFSSVDDEAFLSDLHSLGKALPERLRSHIEDFRRERKHEICIISGYELTEPPGPTPQHWADVRNANHPYDYFFIIASSVLGDVIGFSDLQEGKLAQEIFPIRTDSEKQLGTGAVHLALHTEDTALEYRANYIGFSCNRNIDKIPTDIAIPDINALSEDTIGILRRNVFKIMNDRPTLTEEQRKEAYAITPILYDDEGGVGMRYDPLYMDMTQNNPVEIDALEKLKALVEASAFSICMQPGQVCFIDNNRCAHGRRTFKPRYDGTDRWLKRVQVSNHLKKFSHLCLPGRWNILP